MFLGKICRIMNGMKKKIIFIVPLALLVIGAGVWFSVKTKEARIGDYRGEPIEEIGNDPAIKNFPPAAVEQGKNRLKELAALLEKDPQNWNFWMEVGQLKKFFNNYNGAVAAYEYVKTNNPEDPLVYYNLANLYGSYLGDYPKAEEYYLKAVSYGPNEEYIYLGFAEFYRDFYKAKYDQIENLLLEGLKNVPNYTNLLIQLAYYYKSVNDNQNAIKYFSQLLNAQDIGADQKQAFREEIKALSI